MNWKTENIKKDENIIEFSVFDGVPVMIKQYAGVYPHVLDANDESYREGAFIEIFPCYNGGWKMVAIDMRHCPARQLTVAESAGIDALKAKLADAVHVLRDMGDVYADARKIVATGEGEPLTRQDYETTCGTFGIVSKSDDEIAHSYAINFGEFSFPEYDPEYVREMRVHWRRLMALEREHTHADDAAPAANARCRACGTTGVGGHVPFTTLPDEAGICDDCC